jgi:acyl carrier protein
MTSPPHDGRGSGEANADDLRRLLLTFVPSANWSEGDLVDDLPLGEQGLGLDSVSIVELLVACEARWKVPFPAALLHEPLTIGALTRHLARALAA